MHLIRIGKLSFRLLYIVLAPISNAIMQLMATYIGSYKTTGNTILKPLTLTLFVYLSQVIGGLGTIYGYFSNKKTKGKDNMEESRILAIGTTFKFSTVKNEVSNNHFLICFCYFFFSLISVIQTLILVVVSSEYGKMKDNTRSNLDFELTSITILYISLLSRYVLGYSLYYHQMISLIIVFIGMSLVFIPNISNDKDLEIKIPLLLIQNFLSSFRYVCEKWFMQKKYSTPHQILFFEGIIGFCLSFVFGFCVSLSSHLEEIFGSTQKVLQNLSNCLSENILVVFIIIAFFLFSL